MTPLRRLIIGLSLTAAAFTGTLVTATLAAADTTTTTASAGATPAGNPSDGRPGHVPTLPDVVPLDTWWG